MNHTTVDVSEISQDDVAALRGFWSVSAAARRVDAPLIPMEPFEELLAQPSHERAKRTQRWIARDGDRPVGIAELALPTLDNTEAAILTLEVHPDDRRRGIGRALLAALEDAGRRLGYHTVRLDAGEEQQHSRVLFASAGYREIAKYNTNHIAVYFGEKDLSGS